MKRVLFLLLIVPSVCLFANKIKVGQGENKVTLIESTNEYILVDYKINHFETLPVSIGDDTYYEPVIEKHCNVSEKGSPAVPFLSRSFIIPGNKGIRVEVVSSEFTETELAVAPSKGIIFRDQDPSSIPYEFSEIYNQDEDYPAYLTKAGDPYILRDLRGVNLKVYPIQYNPMKKTLKVYTHLLVRVVFTNEPSANIKAGPVESLNSYFKPVYQQHFMNFDEAKYPTVGELGRMLVICHTSFLGDMVPFVNWKLEKGIPTQLVDVSAIGATTTNIQTFIQNEYNLGNGLTFVLLVGDAAQIPTFTYSGGGSDPTYSLVAGSDDYPDIIVSRFSAETSAQVQTQVERTIYYERDQNYGPLFHYGTGIASEQGAGVGWNGLADWEHMDVLRTRLLNYNYTLVDQFYGTNGATATDVTNALNSGRGIVNYCGHGGTGGWATTGFSSSHVNALTNDYKLPYIHSVACVNGNFTGSTCFAESWLRATNGGDPTGAIAMYASSINQSWSPPMVAQDYSIQHLVDEDYLSIGALWFNGSCAMIDIKGQDGVDMFMTWHIFGDGSLSYKTNNPTSMSVYHDPGISSGQTTFFVDAGVVGALVCLSCPGEIIASGYTNINGQIYLSLPPTISCPIMKLTVTAHNRDTYQGEVIANADGVWGGFVNTDWHNSNNWLDGQVPDATQNVSIIAGRPNYPVVTGTAECQALTIESGANLDINGYKLTVNGDLTIEGNLGISGSTSQLVVTGDVFWESGSTESITGTSSIVEVQGHWYFNAGSDASIDYGFVKFTGAYSYSIYCHSAASHFRHVIIAKDAGKYTLYSSSSTEDMHVTGNLFVYTGATLRQYSTRNLIVDGQFDCDGTHRFFYGAFIYNGPGVIYNPDPASYFSNFVLNSSGTFDVMIDANINGDLTINGGKLDLNGNTLNISGNWTNNIGAIAFTEAGSRVIFDGTADQTIGNDEDFGIIEVNNSGGLLLVSTKDVTCTAYDWTAGGIDVTTGSFTAADLLDNGLFGTFNLDAGGVIDLTNSDGWVDLNCNIDMPGGNMYVRGGTGSSWWPYASNATLTMSGGILDFTDQSIYLNDNASYTFTENITGGTIRTAGSFTGISTTFNPAGGIIELYGAMDVSLGHAASSSFHQVKINKSLSENAGNPPEKIIPHPEAEGKDGSLGPGSPKSGLVTAGTLLDIVDDLRIESGSFDVNGKQIYIDGDLYISGHLIMDASADVVVVGSNVDWDSGSTATCTDGMMYFGNTWSFLSGSEALLSPGHIVITTNIGNKILKNQDDNSCFGDLALSNDFYVTVISPQTNHPLLVDGNLTFYSDTELQISGKQMLVNGNTQMNSSSTLAMLDYGSILTYGSFTCDGTIHMDGGDAYLMGSFLLDTNGSLLIDDGQFVLHAPYTGAYESITGYVELNGGTLQVTYNGIQFGSTSNFVYNGGNMKIGWAFRALYAGTFQPANGTVEFMGTGSPTIEMEASNYFYDLLVNKEGTGTMIMMTPVKVNNDLRIKDGVLNTGANDLTVMGEVIIELDGKLDPDEGQVFVKGDWTNNRGDIGFTETNSTVTFIDFNSCFIRTDEKFHNLNVAKDNPTYCILYLDSGVTVTVVENFSVNDGKMSMSDNSTLHVMNDLYVHSDCEIWLFDYYTNCHIDVDGVAEIGVNGKITLNTGDTAVFNSDFINQGILDITESSVKVHGYFSSTSAASLVLNSGEFIYDQTGATWVYLRGNLEIYSGLFEFTNRPMSTSSLMTSSTISGGLIRMGGNFRASDAGMWMQTGGTMEFIGDAATTIECSGGNHLYDVVVDKGSGTATLNSDLNIQRHFHLMSGILNTGTYDMYVGGSWTNDTGPAAFVENTNTVTFNGTISSYIYDDEDFYNLEVNKTDAMKNILHISDGVSANVLGAANLVNGVLRMRNNTYMHVNGGMTLASGTIAEFPSVYTNSYLEVDGTMYLYSGSLLSLHTGDTAVFNSGFTNVGNIDITDASVTVHGNFSFASGSGFALNSGQFICDQTGTTWVYMRGVFEMYDGLFEFTNRPLSTSSLLTSSTIAGGLVRVGRNFQATTASTWEQTGGTMEFIGNTDGTVNCSNGNHFNNMKVTKGTGTLTMLSDITMLNDFTLEQGQLDTDIYDMFVGGDWDNNAGPSAFAQGTNKVTFNRNQSANIYSDESFYDLEVNKPDPSLNYLHIPNNVSVNVMNDMTVTDGRVRMKSNTFMGVGNNMTVMAGTLFEMPSVYSNSILEVNGTMDLKTGAQMDMDTGDTATFNSTFILAGELNLTDASVNVHGFFSTATSSYFTLNSGEFIYDETGTGWVYMRGNFKMFGGLFEITHRDFSLYSGLNSDIQNGTIRLGGRFSAATAGTFAQKGGTTELIGNANVDIQLAAGNYFNDLDVDRSGGTLSLASNIVVNRDFHMISGYMEAIGYYMNIGRNWTNDEGPGSIYHSNNRVIFFSDQPAMIYSSDEFYDLLVEKPLAGTDLLELEGGIALDIATNFGIEEGTVLLHQGNTLSIGGDFALQTGAGLNANPAENSVLIKLGGDWLDKNSGYGDYLGFNPGLSEVIIDGSADQVLFNVNNKVYFYNLTVNKPSGKVMPDSKITVLNDFYLQDGDWFYASPISSHYFYGNFTIGASGTWSDNLCTIEILGDEIRSFENQGSGNTQFGYFEVDMNSDKEKATCVLVLNSDIVFESMIIYDGTVDVNNHTMNCKSLLQVLQGGYLFVRYNSVIAMENATSLQIFGGRLTMTGNTTQRPLLTHNSGYYQFAVDAGGEFNVYNADFEYMDEDGIRITQNGTIFNSNAFENCSFKNGEPNGTLLWVENDQNLVINNAGFYDNSWGGKFNISKTNNSGSVTFIDATGSFAGEQDEYDPYGLVDWTTSGYKVALTAFLEGPFNSGTMNTNLTAFIPLTQPYSPAPWNYPGTESVVSVDPDYVDWVLVELRDAASAAQAASGTVIERQAAFIRNDGAIVNTNGGTELEFTAEINDGLFVVIWHRNHLGIMSANALVAAGNVYSYDYTTSATQVYGGMNAHKELEPGLWGMAGGDGNADKQINNGDKNDVWSVQAGTGGYISGDFNLDNQVNNGDKNDIWIPNTGIGGQVPEMVKNCYFPE